MRRQPDRWGAHPVLAWWVRLAIVLIPILVALLVALAMIAVLPGARTWPGEAAWWGAVLGAGYLAASAVERLARRGLPLAVLLRLSLVFPDQAPSRLQAARRTSLREIERQVAELKQAGEQGDPAEAARILVTLVGALGLHDKRTRGHSERVRAYVDVLTEELELPEHDRVRLRWAALLHDIGKLSVPGEVLNAGSDLADAQWDTLRRHPAEGERLAAALLPWLGEWGDCVRQHHERWDGSGYPAGLRGTEISLGARIVAVADAYEVMTANRSYHQAVTPVAARRELLRCAGTDFDPAVVRAFMQVSLGRLRGILGPLSVLPAIPLALLSGKATHAMRGLTTVAAVSALAVGVSGTTAPRFGTVPVSVGRAGAVAMAPALVLTHPRPAHRPAPRVPHSLAPLVLVQAPAPQPVSFPPSSGPVPVAPVQPSVTPSWAVLFLAPQGLLSQPPAAGSVRVAAGAPARFAVTLPHDLAWNGPSTMVLFTTLHRRHGHAGAVLVASLSDCASSGCTPFSVGWLVLPRGSAATAVERVALSSAHRTLAAGHVLRLTLTLLSRRDVQDVTISCGGLSASRLLLPA